jgi:hypothetical protein
LVPPAGTGTRGGGDDTERPVVNEADDGSRGGGGALGVRGDDEQLRFRAPGVDPVDEGAEHPFGRRPVERHDVHGILPTGHTRRLLGITFHGKSPAPVRARERARAAELSNVSER